MRRIVHLQCVNAFSKERTSETRFANAVIAVDAIFADTVVTGVTGTIIEVDLTVCACVRRIITLCYKYVKIIHDILYYFYISVITPFPF